MKKLQILLALLLIAITSACQTTQVNEIILPPKPEREIINGKVESVADCAELLVYYEELVQKWELWGDTVQQIVEGNE